MLKINVRRLVAVDMHGAGGTAIRSKLILAEFLLGATLGPALGLFVALNGSGIGSTVFGLWIAGACLNYLPAALIAISLYGRGKLEAELAGVDIGAELRHYTRVQFWIAIPLLFVGLALTQSAWTDPG